MKNVISQSLGPDLVNINVYAKVYQYIPLSSRDGHFHLFRIWRSAKPRPMINVILQFLGLDPVNINVSAKLYQNIPNGLRVNPIQNQKVSLVMNYTFPKVRTPLMTARTTVAQARKQHMTKCIWTLPMSSKPLDLPTALNLQGSHTRALEKKMDAADYK